MDTLEDVIVLSRSMGLLIEKDMWKDPKTGYQVYSYKFFHEVLDGSGRWEQNVITEVVYDEDTDSNDYHDIVGKSLNDLKQFKRWN